jgi:hypothetical protein
MTRQERESSGRKHTLRLHFTGMKLLDADIVIAGDTGLLVVAEVKNVPALSSSAASAYVRNLLAHRGPAPTRYLLLLSQEMAFIWNNLPDLNGPALELDVKPVFDRYLQQGNISGWLRAEELKTLAFHWLGELTRLDPKDYGEIERQLDRINFMSTIRDGTVTMGIA